MSTPLRRILDTHPVMVIAEIGVNHDGSVDRALELVSLARDAGADAVKVQVFRADHLLHGRGIFAGYQSQRVQDPDAAAMLRRYELSTDALFRIGRAVRDAGMRWIATPFSPADVPVLRDIAVDFVKIASPDLVNPLLLRAAADLHRPMLVSTGASTTAETDQSVNWLRNCNADFMLMHCISSYPVRRDDARLDWINSIASRYACPVGYSDHCDDIAIVAEAVAAGARVIEKHLTYDRNASGPDHAASADGAQFARYVRLVRSAGTASVPARPAATIGAWLRTPLPCEADVRRVSRQSLVTTRDIRAGDRITTDALTCKRPGTGISVARLDEIAGAVATRDIVAGSMLAPEDISRAIAA